ncbi:helix-turn-helix domain-containing protein [Anaerovibrio sp. RM50]|uniref:helix-turn-helix domain-containing protein n=1 Tax=Anaerovibrio sp. RM50 TaxID=1200557 RepID=UPI000489F0F4|nr:helix-turn-helix transcriptional regulator [Anaerovibrio sp. RM50]
MINLEQRTATEINKDLAGRVAKLRKRRKLSQQALAQRSGVSFGSVKRFEQTGDISLQSLAKIAIALEVEEELESLFSGVPYGSLEEIINEQGR